MVIQEAHRDPYRAFFTADEALGDYMVSLLDLQEEDLLFEPAAGDGHLIDSVKKTGITCPITAYELNPKQISNLEGKFGADDSVEVVEQDTILCPDLDLRETFGPRFTKILANPPYGGWQEFERRADLKKRFKGFYVRETYSLFLLRCLRLLEVGGKLVFIIPNTFLYLNLHQPLREYILEEFSVESIDVFNSSLFPGISFGYADLCIITIRGERSKGHNSVRIRTVERLDQFEDPDHARLNSKSIQQNDIKSIPGYAFPLSSAGADYAISSDHNIVMGDLAKCVTGFYSGRDKEFLRKASPEVKRAKAYNFVDLESVESNPLSRGNLLNGLSGSKTFVPILKGGGYKFLKPNLWYMDWSEKAVAHYKSDKKARFQNPSYYFREGIGFPMVTSSQPTASILKDALFDQSIVGIFPSEISLEFLLAYCNSAPFWACLKAINPSANNSAKYILRTPIILPDKETVSRITDRTKELLGILQDGSTGATLLETEILESITRYVKIDASNKALEPTALRAVAQL